MEPRTAAARLLVGIGITDFTFRTSQVALPLIVLAGTGSAGATGLVGGAAGIPVLTSPWWARRLRQRISTGRSLALCYGGEALSLSVVALAATLGQLEVATLALAGLALGVAEALDGPGRDSMLADLGDELGPDRALSLLTLREFFRRVSMVAGPVVGGLLVANGRAVILLWVEVVSILVSAALAWTVVPRHRASPAVIAPGIWATVRVHRDVLAGWIVRGTGCALWFGFTLGLALLGVAEGRGGTLLAAGMAAYGAGSAIGTAGVVRLLRAVPVLPAIAAAWAVTGACWIVMGRFPTLPAVASAGFVSGLAIVVGNTGVTAQITRRSEGAERRTLMAGQSIVVNAASSAGLLLGGPLLAHVGARATLQLTGVVTIAVSAACVLLARDRRRQPKRPATSAARAPYPPPNRQACTRSGNSWWSPTRSAQPSASGETSS